MLGGRDDGEDVRQDSAEDASAAAAGRAGSYLSRPASCGEEALAPLTMASALAPEGLSAARPSSVLTL